MSHALLEVEDLHVRLRGEIGEVRALEGVSLQVGRGEIVGLVGESGSGKTMTSLALLGLLPRPHGRVLSGSIRFDGEELVGMTEAGRRALRGRRMAMIFQDPMTSLNPYLRIGEQIAEGARLHLGLSRAEAAERAYQLLERVGMPDSRARLRSFPHELSGGMRQRAMIAMALLSEPELLIADEPTTALDVTIQAQILHLLAELRRDRGTAILLITHDLGVVSGLCDRVLVMYAGRVVEAGPTRALFDAPSHPYTRALLRSTPRIDAPAREPLESIEGLPPRLDAPPLPGCRFAPRCRFAGAECEQGEPPLLEVGGRERRCVYSAAEIERRSAEFAS